MAGPNYNPWRAEDAQGREHNDKHPPSSEHPRTIGCSSPDSDLKEAVVVVGMHRSGTSLCMNVLKVMGIRVDEDLIPADANNEQGYFESRRILELNEDVLACLGATWHTLLSVSLGENWADRSVLDPAKQQLAALISTRVNQNSRVWGLKDPRISLMLPMYDQVFAACCVRPKYVLCLRDPRSVSMSLMHRNRFPYIFSELLWLEYTITAAKVAADRLKAIIQYENWFENGFEQARLLAEALGISENRDDNSLKEVVEMVVNPSLDHGSYKARAFELSCTESIYRLLQAGNVPAAIAAFSEVQQALTEIAHSASYNRKAEHGRSSAGTHITCQLFWCTAQQAVFHEVDSSRVETEITSVRKVIQLPIPEGLDSITRIRLDPA